MDRVEFNRQVEALERAWKSDPRWRGIERPYTASDVVRLRDAGADAVLIGESLMRESDIGVKLQELTGGSAQ